MIVEFTNGNERLFKNMNRAVVDSYKRKGSMPNLGQHRDTFEQTYNVKIIVKNNIWAGVEFPDEQAYTLAALKWS